MMTIEANIEDLFPQCPRCKDDCKIKSIHPDDDMIEKPVLLEYECGACYEPTREHIMNAIWRVQDPI